MLLVYSLLWLFLFVPVKAGFFDNIVNQGGQQTCGGQQCGSSNFLWYFNCCGTTTQACCLHVQIWVYFAVIIGLVVLITACLCGSATCLCYKICSCCRRDKGSSKKTKTVQKNTTKSASASSNSTLALRNTPTTGRKNETTISPPYAFSSNGSSNIDSSRNYPTYQTYQTQPISSPVGRKVPQKSEQSTQTYLSVENRFDSSNSPNQGYGYPYSRQQPQNHQQGTTVSMPVPAVPVRVVATTPSDPPPVPLKKRGTDI